MEHDERTVSAVGEIAHNFVPSFAWLSRGCDVELNLAFNNFEGGHSEGELVMSRAHFLKEI